MNEQANKKKIIKFEIKDEKRKRNIHKLQENYIKTQIKFAI